MSKDIEIEQISTDDLNTGEMMFFSFRSLYLLWLDAKGYSIDDVGDVTKPEPKLFIKQPYEEIMNLEQLFKAQEQQETQPE